MALTITEIREKYPQYVDMSDQQLADALHTKHYSDMPIDEFYSKIGLNKNIEPTKLPETKSFTDALRQSMANTASNAIAQGLEQVFPKSLQANFGRGVAQGAEESTERGVRGLSQLFGGDQPQGKLPESEGLLQSGGRALGNIGGYGVMSAPFVLGGEALAPGLVGQSIGAGYAGLLESPGDWKERVKEGAIGAAIPTVVQGIGKAISKIPSVTSKNIAKKVIETKAQKINQYTDKFNNLWKEAEQQGIKKVSVPKINSKLIEKETTPAYHENLLKFLKDPTLENAHWAQSDLGKLERSLKKSNVINPLPGPKLKALQEVKKAKDSINKAMFEENKLGGNEALSKKYSDIKLGYRKDVVPYKSIKAISDFESGELLPKDFVRKLKNNTKFRAQLQKDYPEININSLLKSKWSKGLGASILAGLGFKEGMNLGK